MERQFTETLAAKGILSFDQVVARYLQLEPDQLLRRLRRRGIWVPPPVPAGIVSAMDAVTRTDGSKLPEALVLSGALESGLGVIEYAEHVLKVLPDPSLSFKTSVGFDEMVSKPLPSIPMVDFDRIKKLDYVFRRQGAVGVSVTQLALIAGIAHSASFFPDDLNAWATDVVCRFLAMGEDGT